MPTPAPPPRRDDQSTGLGAGLAGLGVLAAMVLCCAGPVLLTAGVLAGIGGFLGNPWVIAAAVLLLAAAVTTVIRRRRSGRDASCCPPTTSPSDSADRDRSHDPANTKGRYQR